MGSPVVVAIVLPSLAPKRSLFDCKVLHLGGVHHLQALIAQPGIRPLEYGIHLSKVRIPKPTVCLHRQGPVLHLEETLDKQAHHCVLPPVQRPPAAVMAGVRLHMAGDQEGHAAACQSDVDIGSFRLLAFQGKGGPPETPEKLVIVD